MESKSRINDSTQCLARHGFIRTNDETSASKSQACRDKQTHCIGLSRSRHIHKTQKQQFSLSAAQMAVNIPTCRLEPMPPTRPRPTAPSTAQHTQAPVVGCPVEVAWDCPTHPSPQQRGRKKPQSPRAKKTTKQHQDNMAQADNYADVVNVYRPTSMLTLSRRRRAMAPAAAAFLE